MNILKKGIALIVIVNLIFLSIPSTNDSYKTLIPEPSQNIFRVPYGTRADDNTTWLGNWTYRRNLNITGKEGAGTNYQINLEAFYDFGFNRTTLTLESIQGIPDFGETIVHNNTLHFGAMESGGTELYFYTYNTSNATLIKYELPHTAGSSDGHHRPTIYRDIYGYWWAFCSYNTDGIYWMRTNYTDRFDEWNGSYQIVDQGTYAFPYQNPTTGRLYILHRKFDGMGSNFTIDYTDDNGTTWICNQSTIFPSNTGPHNCYYIDAHFDITTERLHISAIGERSGGINEVRDNIHYVYTDDYGTTWKDTNGTLVTNITDAVLTIGGYSRSHMNVDENHRPMFSTGLSNTSDKSQNFLDFYYLRDGTNWEITRIGDYTSYPWGPKKAPLKIGTTIYVLAMTDYTATVGDEYLSVYWSEMPYTVWERFDFNYTNTRNSDYVDNGIGYGLVNGIIYYIGTREGSMDETMMFKFPFETDDNKITFDRKCRTDFEDIRFTDNDGITELDYWIEYRVNGTYATFWIEVADNLNTSQSIYVYWGNSSATYTNYRQHGIDTFILFDGNGWNGSVDWVDRWQSTNHSKYNVENGLLNISRGNQDLYTDRLLTQSTYGNGMAIESYIKCPVNQWLLNEYDETTARTGKDRMIIKQSIPSLHVYLNGVNVQKSTNPADKTHYFKIKYLLPSDGNANLTIKSHTGFYSHAMQLDPAYRQVYVGYVAVESGAYSLMDNMFIRKFTNLTVGEPNIAFWGSEQVNPNYLYIRLYETIWNFNGYPKQGITYPELLLDQVPNCTAIVGKNVTTEYWYTYWPEIGFMENWTIKYGDGLFFLVDTDVIWQVSTYEGPTNITHDIWNPVVYAGPNKKVISTIYNSISYCSAIVGKNTTTNYWYTYWPELGIYENEEIEFGDGLFILASSETNWDHN